MSKRKTIDFKVKERKIRNNSTIVKLTKILSGRPKDDSSYASIFDTSTTLKLTGGAVTDIMDGRKPKDYDFVGWTDKTVERLLDGGFIFVSETKTAKTFKKGYIVVQLLHTFIENFEYTISQATYAINSRSRHEKNNTLGLKVYGRLEIDELSYIDKVLIPVNFHDRGQVYSCLARLPKWQAKGYTLPEMTYLSLLNAYGSIRTYGS